MSRKSRNLLKSFMVITIILTMLSSVSFAAWWGTSFYEWARARGLTSMITMNAANNKVSHDNFYSILLKYLNYKGVRPDGSVMQDVGTYKSQNKALEGFVREIEAIISKKSLTNNEYRNLATYIEAVKDLLGDNQKFLTRDNLKNLNLYLSLAKYKGATLIADSDYRALILSNNAPTLETNVGIVKHKALIDYGIKPYYNNITRGDFLILMFSLLSEQSLSEEEIINQFYESGVIKGYSEAEVMLELEQELTYVEMFAFLNRFEFFDFNPVAVEGEGDDVNVEDGVIEYK